MASTTRERFEARYIGAVGPQLYVGLGGVGIEIVLRIRERLQANARWRRYREPCVGFVALDTNENDLTRAKHAGVPHVHLAQRGRAHALERLRRKGDTWLEQWLPDAYEPRENVPGAGQIRVESRVGFYVFSERIEDRLDRVLDRLFSVDNTFLRQAPKNLEVFVFGSLAGGTCSGSFLSAAGLLREVVEDRGWSPRLFGYFLTATSLEGIVADELGDFIHANTYAALKELERLNKCGYEDYDDVPFPYRQPDHRREALPLQTLPPYDWVVLVDEPAGMDLGVKMPWAVADLAYLNLMTPAASQQASERDNYTRFMNRASHVLGEDGTLTEAGFTKHFGTFGGAALVCPEETLLEYCKLRFLATAFRSQFSTEARTAGAEAGPAPERLNVNDPRLKGTPEDVVARLLARQWCDEVKRLAIAEEKAAVDKAEWLRSLGEEVDLSKDALGEWSRLFRVVEGEPAFLSTESAGPARGKGKGSRSGGSRKGGGLRSTVHQHFLARAKAVDKVDKKPPPRMDIAVSLTSDLAGLQREFEDQERSRVARCEAWATDARAGEVFDKLRQNESGFDAMQERYLVMRLLLEDIEGWITATEKRVDSLVPASLAWEDKEGRRKDEFSAIQQEAKSADSWKVVGKKKKEAVRGDAHAKAQDLWDALVKKSNELLEARALLAQLESFRQYLRERSASYTNVARSAESRADGLDDEAWSLLVGGELHVDDFYLRLEALDPLDEALHRQWDLFWEDVLLPDVEGTLTDGSWLGQLVGDALAAEEARARDPRNTFAAHNVLKRLQAALTAKADELLRPLISGDPEADGARRDGLTLIRALEYEARYCTMSEAERGDPVSRQRLLEPGELPDDRVGSYMEAKLTALRDMAQPLARLAYTKLPRGEGTAVFASGVLIGHQDLFTVLDERFQSALAVMTEDAGELDSLRLKVEIGSGLQEWDDPRMLVAFKGYGVLPVYVFDTVSKSHGAYWEFMDWGENKPHMLHTAKDWEHTLQDLDDQAVEAQESEDRELLVRALSRGVVVRKRPRGKPPVWSLEVSKKNVAPLCECPTDLARSLRSELARDAGRAAAVHTVLGARSYDDQRTRVAIDTLKKFVVDEGFAGGRARRLQPVERLVKALEALREAN